ncbi:ABC transporter substrate-binding protein [Paucisalibacillus globulus]|uniref:ABC transporter substrate-binding protein n=1 Tax=Paucisalibacillus globulus TaxID=351095 RepID=UPI000420EEDE|nr:extracellular solute-binding protein [Paucisalibacillus globulus]
MKYKKLILFMILLIASGMLFACSDKDSKSSSSEENVDVIELNLYSWRPEDRKAYEKFIEVFESENPGIKINFQPFESTEYNTILTNSLVSGSGPDIVQLRPYSGTKSIADNGYLTPLNDVPGVMEIEESFLEAAKGSDGQVYGVPTTLNAGVIFYNKDIFEEYGLEAPETWDDLLQVSKELKNNGIIPIAQAGRAAYLLSMLHGVISPSAYGGNDYVDEIIAGNTDLTDPKMLETLERMQEIEQYFPEDFIALDDNDVQALFYAGEAAMYINGDYRLGTFETNAPDMNIGVVPGLKADGPNNPLVMNWVDGSYGVVEHSEHKEEALKFIEFMATKEFGQLFSDELNRLSAINGVEPKHELVQQITKASEANTTPYLLLVYFGEGSPTTKTVFEDSLQGMYLGEITKEQVLEDAQKNVERVATEVE